VNNELNTIGVIGLGYVGLPLLELISQKYNAVGFDISKKKIDSILSTKKLNVFSAIKDLMHCNIFIVCVPTPILDDNNPDTSFLESASSLISTILKKNDIVIFESTTYPGCTEDVCIPLLEKSGLKVNDNFYVGYSPERVQGGGTFKELASTSKIVSASNDYALDIIRNFYESIITADIVCAKSIKTAEFTKLMENTQRDVNIALMNELCFLAESLDIDFLHSLFLASSKFNFYNATPGLVGGHCIAVDPYYLIDAANRQNIALELVELSRKINDNVVQKIVNKIMQCAPKNVLILGATFKENCDDIRNSLAANLFIALNEKVPTVIYDKLANTEDFKKMYNIDISYALEEIGTEFDIVLIAVHHSYFNTQIFKNSKIFSAKQMAFLK